MRCFEKKKKKKKRSTKKKYDVVMLFFLHGGLNVSLQFSDVQCRSIDVRRYPVEKSSKSQGDSWLSRRH